MSSAAGVKPEQRFSPARPCPICGGHDQMQRGEGVRCYGFLSDDARVGPLYARRARRQPRAKRRERATRISSPVIVSVVPDTDSPVGRSATAADAKASAGR